MNKMKLFRIIALLLSLVIVFPTAGVVLAQEEEKPPAPEIEIKPIYPKLEAIAGGKFEFEVQITFLYGEKARDFDLKATAPPSWEVYMTPKYEASKKVSAIRLEPSMGFSSPQNLLVHATAPFWPLPDPGEYKIKLDVSSGDVKGSLELTAVVTAKYFLNVVPTNQLYNTNAKPGKDNFFSIDVNNLGTAAIENIKFTTTKPEGWTIEFTPEKVETLGAFDSQTMEVNIKPPANTIAGDYNISLRGSGTQATADEVTLRVTVETPTVWGWVGVGIIIVVVAGLILVFMRFSRR